MIQTFEVTNNISVKPKIANTRIHALIQCREINGVTLGAITFSAPIIKGSRIKALNSYSSPPHDISEIFAGFVYAGNRENHVKLVNRSRHLKDDITVCLEAKSSTTIVL